MQTEKKLSIVLSTVFKIKKLTIIFEKTLKTYVYYRMRYNPYLTPRLVKLILAKLVEILKCRHVKFDPQNDPNHNFFIKLFCHRSFKKRNGVWRFQI